MKFCTQEKKLFWLVLLFLLLPVLQLIAQPAFTSPAPATTIINISESPTNKIVVLLAATGTGTITYGLAGGGDTSSFFVDPATHNLCFKFFPDYENPRGRNITTTSATVSNTYYITIQATDDNGPTYKGITINVLNVNENPDPPRDLFVISQDQSNILKWTGSVVTAGITEYRIYRSEDSITWNYRDAVPIGTTTYNDNSLVNGKFYFYTVRAWNGVSESVNSNVDASTPYKTEISRYMHFDGNNDFMVASDSSKLMGAPSQLGSTMECWVRFNTLPSHKVYVLSRDYNLPNAGSPSNGSTIVRWYSIYYDPNGGGAGIGRIMFEYNVQGSAAHQRVLASTTVPVINKWYHVAGTFSYIAVPIWYPVRLYINGHLENFVAGTNGNVFENWSSTGYPAESRFVIGGTTTSLSPFTYDNFLDGDICEARYWTIDCDSTTIKNNMYNRLRGDEANLIGLWHLDTLFNNLAYDYDNLNFNAVIQGDVCTHSPKTIAVDDIASIQASIASYIDVKKNDIYSSPRKTVKTKIISGPSHGLASVANLDSISYNPGCFLGTDTIKYLICDTTFFRNPYQYSDTAIAVITVNDNPPIITSNGGGATASVNMNENGTSVTTVIATDIDVCHSKTYSISGGADQAKFSINSSSGALTFITAPNFEIPTDVGLNNVYDVQVTVSDGSLTDVQDIAVAVQNVNDNNPVITATDKTIAENTTAVETVTATDADAGDSQTFSISGTDAALFVINSSTGVLTFLSAPNFESPDDVGSDNIYDLTVTITDGASHTDSKAIKVTVTDVVEISSFTINAIADATVAENTAYTSVTPVITGTPIGTVTYSLGGADASAFTINASTGVVSMVARNYESPVDANADNIYELSITATDADGNFDSEDWTVTVTDVVEISSFTINAIADATVAENTAYTSVTPAITGTPIGTVSYTLGGADAGAFSINASTGVVGMVARNYESPVDANADNIYELTITATDADGNSDTEDWTVTVTDVVEISSFTINAIADATVAENTAYTSVTPVITGTPIGTVTYSLGGADASAFTINASTGVVGMVARNYESPVDANADNIYELTITATDADGNSDTEDWTVTVTDVVEISSFTINAIADASVAENTAYTSVTPVITGTPIGTVSYTLGGADAGAFSINASTGVVGMVARNYESPVDANADNIYELSITATDADGNSDTEDWTVTVTDMVEISSFTINAIADASVAENTAYTSVTPVITGTPIGTVSYTLGGADAGAFSINASTGVVSMVARNYESPVDANADNIYELSITATDADGNSDTEDWTVTVTDVVEISSFTINAIADASVAENTAYTSVTPVITGTPIGTVSYTLGGADAGAFSINASTGVVGMVARNYESPVDANADNIYELTITATDADGNSDTEDWTVTVTDMVEISSFTINAIADASVAENTAYTSVTPVITGTPIGTVSYTLGGADAGAFSINASTGVVGMVARNYESPVDANADNIYELTITATDADGNSDTEDWTVTVTDMVEISSFTINAIADATVAENTAYTSVTPVITGTPIGTVTYSLGGADASAFTINASTGVVGMVARNYESPVDANADNIYELSITATDADGNSDTEDWTVTVTDVVEISSFTINAIADATVAENTAYTSVTPVITGTPIGTVTYSLGGADASAFTINASTGVVGMVARNYESPVDANADNIYELTITATDADGNSDTEDWTVTVTDMVEISSFTINAIADASVAENTAYTSVTPVITGTPIGTVSYTLGGADAGAFSINASTGVVGMVARNYESPVDANADNIYELTITATDADGNSDTEDWTVTVTDMVEISSFTINAIADATVAENTAYTSVTPVITGTPIGTVTYSLGGADASAFTINASTGVVGMVARNYESPVDANADNIYELSITATDADGNSDTEDWTVTVTDVVEISSFTINAIADATVAENTAYTSVTPVITGTPIGTVTYSLGGADASAFTINASTGVVGMVARNYESPVDANADNIYELTITATDADGNSDTEDWTVTVTDVVEISSFTINAIADASVAENTAYTSVTPVITGTPIGTVSYTLGGADAGAFSINASTGVVGMVARNYESPVDANADNIYELTITATDADGNSDTEDWTVTVTDVVEISSFTINAIADATVAENTAYTSVTPVITGTPIGTVTYSLGGADASAFTINASTGVVGMVARNYESPVDANADNIYELTITATDADGNSDTEDWTVTVTDVVEISSFTINAIADASVAENTAYTSVTPVITGTPIGTVSYTLGGADAGAFSINASTGVVGMVARNYESPVDANADNIYELTITATDADGNSDTEDWTVTVTDVVEISSFTINAIADASVAENTAYTSVTPVITGTPIGTVSYTLGGADAGAFSINASTGVVSMVARNYESPVDANADNIYELSITATDADGNFDSEDWTVTVTDVVEISSFTINAIADATVAENTAYTSVTPAITGTPIGTVSYTLGGADAGAFSINASTGVVGMVARNYESPVDANADNIYELSITATDADGNSDTEDWTVTVTDVVEISSFTINAIADASVAENTAYTSVTPVITGTPIGTVSYTLGGADAGAFSINASTGVVSMVARNYESPVDANADNIYELSITATDADGNSDTEDWTVTVTDMVEISSFTINAIADASVAENTAYTSVTPVITGTPIGTVSYTLGGADAGAFSINASTGVVSMVARNYESPVDANADNIYELSITATDADGNSDTEDWTVTVTDMVEISSFTINAIADASVAENTAYTSVTPVITGTPIGTVSYTLGGADAGAFSINASTGVVSMVARNYESPVDANADNIYELSITATDADGNSDTEDWTVTVTDMVEISSFTINAIADATVAENTAYTSVTPVITGTPIGTVSYTLGGADAGAFSINASTGVVGMVARNYESPVDANADNIYELSITATDADGNSDTEDWTVTVTDVVEISSFTINAIADATVAENTAYTSVTPVITGTPIGTVSYTLGGADAGAFSINASTGVVSMVARNYESPVDANADNIYELSITATDADGNSDTEDWTVTVTDMVEISSFTINAIADASVAENTAYTSVTPVITGTPIGTVSYTLGGADAGAFSINASTGVVSMVARNYESPVDANADNIYELSITATDADGNSDTEDWTVTVTDVVEISSFTINAIADATVAENTAYTSVTPVITGTPIGTVSYTLGGADAGAFSINASTGVVGMVARNYESPVDANADNIYELSITATDADGNSDTEDWTVTVTDMVEISSFTINAIADASVAENTAYTSVTPVITGTPIGTVSYTLGGADAGAFTINASTGVVRMVARNYESPVDANADNIYELSITATDADGNFDTEDWTVTVTDVVEVSSFNINAITDATVAENTAYTSVTPVITGTPIGTVTYTLGGTDASAFTINASTGVVSMVARNYESPVDANTDNIYELSITATDADGNLDTEDWTVTVTDVVEVSSFTINAIADATVAENAAYTSVTPAITGTPIGTVTYTLGGTDAGAFTINASTGVVSMVARNYESPVDANADNIYELSITATDADGNSDTEDWTVTVINVNEAPIDITISKNDIDENLPVGTQIGIITTTDSDTGDTFTYSFVSGSDEAVFTLVGNTLNSALVFDYSTRPSYSITIRTTDGGGLTFDKTFTININLVNHAPTDIILSNNNINERQPIGTFIGTLSSVDVDTDDSHTYSFVSGGDEMYFAITGNSLRTNAIYDYETRAIYSITIRTTDNHGATFDKLFTINVNDINEPPTDITLSNYQIEENLPARTLIGFLGSIDQDAGDTHVYTFVPGGDEASFVINGNTLESAVSFDYEMKSSYSVRIRSTDLNGASFEKNITIIIINVNETPVILNENNIAADTLYSTAYTNELSQICLNVTDPDNDIVSISSLISITGNGTASFASENNPCFHFQSLPDFIGLDLISIKVCDNGNPMLCDSVIMVLDVHPRLVIPQAISPNQDGVNDTWVLGGIEDYPDNKVSIFSRWGDIVFQINGYDNSNTAWNGKFSDERGNGLRDLPDGTYFYIIQLNKAYKFSGFVVLKR